MSYKKNNPARTTLVLHTISVSLFIFTGLLLLLTLIAAYVTVSENSLEAGIDFSIGICGFWSIFVLTLIYSVVAFSISLWGRGVYGKKHETYAMIGFFLGIGGFVLLFILPFITAMIGNYTLFVITIFIPFLMMIVGMYLFIKDIGGMVMGAIGVGIYSFGTLIAVFFLLLLYHGTSDTSEMSLIGLIFATLIGITGLVVLLVGYINAFQWTAVHEPLIDEQEAQQLQMQQQQMNLQHEGMQMQREQLYLQQQTVQMIQNQSDAMIQAGTMGNIPDRSSAKVEEDDWFEDDDDW
ncbi:MAG: hypothetical protein U9R75_00365 [Candidatus Thermoplasmatota archaeon]|nr:hypothetical protein [Candidatus Thermoplasmatota archaeon]